jgi:hypothetical protein
MTEEEAQQIVREVFSDVFPEAVRLDAGKVYRMPFVPVYVDKGRHGIRFNDICFREEGDEGEFRRKVEGIAKEMYENWGKVK